MCSVERRSVDRVWSVECRVRSVVVCELEVVSVGCRLWTLSGEC